MSTSVTSPKLQRLALSLIVIALAALGLAACRPTQARGPGEPKLAEEIVVYSTSEEKMDVVFDAFTKETGVRVKLKHYESPEQALKEIQAGAIYDVLTLDSQLVPAAIAQGLLAPIDYRNVTNFKNISADFRNLTYDPENKHTVPFSWGTAGLVVRADRVAPPITRWADLWDPRYAGKVVGWLLPRWTLGAVGIEHMRAGPRYDVVVMESRLVAPLIQSGLLAELDHRSLPNLKNLSADFRDLAYDPGNSHSIPFSWGTTGLVVRSDLVETPVTRWADLRDRAMRGKPPYGSATARVMATLKSLGYSANSETREELEAALARLLELRPTVVEIEDPNVHWPEVLADGQVVVAMGYANDMIAGRTLNPAVTFVLPAEGPLLWNDTFVVPANSPHQATAELFLDFMLRPEISAEFVNKASFATPNDAALPLVLPKIAYEPAIFPPKESLGKAEPILPLSPAGEALYADVWQRFLAGRP